MSLRPHITFLTRLATFLPLFATIAAFGQQSAGTFRIAGSVTDYATGEPVVGANVVAYDAGGRPHGAAVGADGRFAFNCPTKAATLRVSMLGYRNETVKLVPGRTDYDIRLREAPSDVGEVVVTGFVDKKRESYTGATHVIQRQEIENMVHTNVLNIIQLQTPGFEIFDDIANGSDPNKIPDMVLRGRSSFIEGDQTNVPLFILDGTEVDISYVFDMPSDDIESISVLKDASASAIYGAKASAGVVLITTKAGKKGQRAHVTYNGRFGWAKNTTSTDFIDTGYDHVRIVNQFMNDSSDGTMDIFRYTEENGGLQKLYERRNDRTPHPDRPWVEVGNDGKYYYYGNFDWYGYFYNRVRSQQEHNLSLSGSTDKVSYYASGRFYQQYGMFNINKDKFNDYAFRTKVSARIAPWLKYSNNTSFDTTDYKYGGHQDYEGTINALQSNICAAFLPYNPDGTIVQYVNQLGKNSPIGAGRGGQMTADRSKNTREKRYLTFSNQFDVTLFKKLVLTAVYDYRQRDNLFKYRNNTFEYSRQQGVVETFTSGSVENSYREIHQTYKGHNVNIYGTYENSWGGHNLKITAGGQYEDYRSTSLDAKQTDLSSDDIDSFTVATGPITLSQSITAYRTLGFFGRVNYDYKGRYIFEASARGDGSSRFESDHRWGFFPSASAAWRISEESFFTPARDIVDNLKLRLSVGSLGNQQVSNYAYIEQIST